MGDNRHWEAIIRQEETPDGHSGSDMGDNRHWEAIIRQEETPDGHSGKHKRKFGNG